jgi:hypothetical protein
MNGLVFYLSGDIPIVHGHTIYIDPPWALTSISQRQFWEPDTPVSRYADGSIGGILSVDISNWCEDDPTPSYIGQLRACNCRPADIADFTWKDVTACLPQLEALGEPLHHVLDPAIRGLLDKLRERGGTLQEAVDATSRDESWKDIYTRKLRNLEPLLVNEVNTLVLRPDAYTRIPNLFLASDYVRTHTDLATMEAANEAARRAVNAILDREGSRARKCRVWKLREPWLLAIYRWRDRRRYDRGLPWRNPSPWLFRLGRWIAKLLGWLRPGTRRRRR